MPALSKSLSAVALFVGAEGLRQRRKSGGEADEKASGRHIGGVPVFNYDQVRGNGDVSATSQTDWVVVMKSGVSDIQIQSLCDSTKQCKMVGHPGQGGVPFFEMHGSERDLEEVLQRAGDEADFVEPALFLDFQPETIEEDMSASTWGLNRIGSSRDSRDAQGRGVHLYVFDTGVRASHVEFSGRVVPSLDMTIGKDPVICNGDLDCARDDRVGHGTHCAGIAASDSYGVAPLATVYAVKVLGDYGVNPWDWTYGGVDWLILNKQFPAVASMSLGSPMRVAALKPAMDALVNSGITVVVAAGNDNKDACGHSPAWVPSVITVGATTASDAKSSFSNFGPCTDIWAPGSNIMSTGFRSDTEKYALSGTSMACPFVSGGAALLLEKNPDWSPAKLREHMMANTVDYAISGLIWSDTNKLLYVSPDGPPPTPPPAPTPEPPTPAPTPAPLVCPSFGEGPDGDGDCKCKSGMRCYEGGTSSCTCGATATKGYKCSTYFLPGCTNCSCK